MGSITPETNFLTGTTHRLLSKSPVFSVSRPSLQFLPKSVSASLIQFQDSPNYKHNDVVLGRRNNGLGGCSLPPAAVKHVVGSVIKTDGLRFAIVVARFNEVVTRLLLEGAVETFKRYSIKEEDIDVVWVPSCFEIPVVAERLGKLRKYQAIVCIGAVVRGDTTHYDAVANSAASGVLSAGVPCIFGVLTCDDMDQAINRAGGKSGNKGAEAALTAVTLEDQVVPPPNHGLSGRPRKVRIRGKDEETKVGKRSCKACNGIGHNNRTCEWRQNEEARKAKRASILCTHFFQVCVLRW